MRQARTMHSSHTVAGIALALALGTGACARTERVHPPTPSDGASTVHPERWPVPSRPAIDADAALESRIDDLLRTLRVEDKVGQIIQADVAVTTPEDVRRYRLGSVLSGGDSAPGGDDLAPARVWLEAADAYYLASMNTSHGGHAIPLLWAVDAVHGHNNIVSATLFPHNIGLGATRNVELIRRIGAATARELRVTGHDWTFAPTVAVAQDVRWGRTYESYSQDPALVSAYATAMIEGLQGRPDEPGLLRGAHVIASAKHFIGDGATLGGRDQGDSRVSEATLRDVHGAPYRAALASGVQTIMASFSSWQGAKVHGHKGLLTDVLKTRMGFDGFIVGDWSAHEQLAGCTSTSCAAAINAGLDMFMAPGDWKALHANTLAQVRSGSLPMARLDDAVRRILRVKLRAGLFDAGTPSSRPLAGQFALLGAAEHRALARQAVRESLVLLKNDDALLPLRPTMNVLVAGPGADSIAMQSGGWTLSWQGGQPNSAFPNAESIWRGVETVVAAAGGRVALDVQGDFTTKPDVAIVVFGEAPYAEWRGDRASLDHQPGEGSDLRLLKKLRTLDIPVVAVFLSGRPLWITPELDASDAFVAAWLPGSEGGGIADVLFADGDGRVRHDFKGKLSFDWPGAPTDRGVDAQPLYAYGFGLHYTSSAAERALLRSATPQRSTRIRTSQGEPR